MRLHNAYCLDAGSTLAKVMPDTNLKFCQARKIREAFSNPYLEHTSLITLSSDQRAQSIETVVELNESSVPFSPHSFSGSIYCFPAG